MDKIIVPYVVDSEHNAPKYILPQAYGQVHLSTVSVNEEGEKNDVQNSK